jgi:hypothetical protein
MLAARIQTMTRQAHESFSTRDSFHAVTHTVDADQPCEIRRRPDAVKPWQNSPHSAFFSSQTITLASYKNSITIGMSLALRCPASLVHGNAELFSRAHGLVTSMQEKNLRIPVPTEINTTNAS